MTRLRRAIVVALDRTCTAIDGLPDWTWRIPLLHRLGCPTGLSLLAFRLAKRWWPDTHDV